MVYKILLLLWLTGVLLTLCSQSSTTTARWRLHGLTIIELTNMGTLENHLINKRFYINTIERDFSALTAVREHQVSRNDFLENALSVHVMVRRLVEEWSPLAVLVGRIYGMSSLGLGNERWPNQDSLLQASEALMRSQLTFDLKTSHLANGILNGVFMTNVSASDSYAIAFVHWKYWYFSEAIEWLQEALNKILLGDVSISKEKVLQLLVPALCYKGDTEASREMLQKLITLYPNTRIAKSFESYYTNINNIDCRSISTSIENSRNTNMYGFMNKEEFMEHKQLCQDKLNKLGEGLRCRYVHYQQPHLRFQPFKLEEIQLDPPVLRFYDAITNKESTDLLTESLPNLGIAGTRRDAGEVVYSYVRKSHNLWLTDTSCTAKAQITQRSSDMTHLDTSSAENYQVSRYSVAGEYLTHRDILKPLGLHYEDDRIATMMFYLNDVKEGGNTVFTKWGLSVRPVKNSALLWFNYKRNGQIEEESWHSGCPILKGTKWVLNRWVKNGGQEFVMPCGLHSNSSFKYYYM